MNKHTKTSADKGIVFLLLPSLMGIMVSFFSLVGLTLAWFHTSMRVEGSNMTAANFDVIAEVKNTEATSEIIATGKSFDLPAGIYEIAISRCGTSKTSAGYALLAIGDNLYHTELLELDNAFTFQIATESLIHIELTPRWGTIEDSSSQKISSQETLTIANTEVAN